MNTTIFWRIVWKEYRVQRAFWISMAVLVCCLELVLLVYPSELKDDRFGAMIAAALVLPAFYALGSAATLFATERETETYDFLRALPAKPLVVFAGKVVFALASMAALFLFGWTLATVLAGKLPRPLPREAIWTFFGVGGEVVAWGIFFSLLLKRTIVVAVLAGTATFASIYWIPVVMVMFETTRDLLVPVDVVIKVNVIIAVILTVADVALASRWFSERWFSRPQPQSEGLSEAEIDALFSRFLPAARASDAAHGAFATAPAVRTMLGRLLWQELRQSAVMTAALFGMLLPMVLFFCLQWIFGTSRPPGHEPWSIAMGLLGSAGCLSPLLLGASVFLGDQTGCRFRFLTEHGIPPRLVWLSRQVRGLLVMLLGLLLVLPPMIGRDAFRGTVDWTGVGYVLGFAVLAYACGQLCSMAFRSGILAAAFGGMLTLVLYGWAAIMHWFGLSWLWSVAPLPLAFLVATCLHTPDWLLERSDWRARLRPALIVALPALAILAAIPPVRVYEIRLVGPGFDTNGLTWPIPPGEKETLALYHRAINMTRQGAGGTPLDETAQRKAEEQAVTLAVEAGRRPLPGFYVDPLVASEPEAEIKLGELVLASGKTLQAAGKLDVALERYVAAERIALHARQCRPWLVHADDLEIGVCKQLMQWAAEKAQKPDRVLKGLRTVEQLWRTPPAFCEEIKRDYLLNRRILEGDREAFKELRGSIDQELCVYLSFTRWLPWERARALRLLDKLTAEQFVRCQQAVAELPSEYFVPLSLDVNVSPEPSKDLAARLVKLNMPDNHLDHWLMVESYRAATRLILALEAWKLEHGGLPEPPLHCLMGKYFDQLPGSPYSGNQFLYEPKGLPYAVEWSPPNSNETKTLEAGQPFVACNYCNFFSTWGRTLRFDGGSLPREETAVCGSSKRESWSGVWVFPIP